MEVQRKKCRPEVVELAEDYWISHKKPTLVLRIMSRKTKINHPSLLIMSTLPNQVNSTTLAWSDQITIVWKDAHQGAHECYWPRTASESSMRSFSGLEMQESRGGLMHVCYPSFVRFALP
jgi:hypothetical protein